MCQAHCNVITELATARKKRISTKGSTILETGYGEVLDRCKIHVWTCLLSQGQNIRTAPSEKAEDLTQPGLSPPSLL